MKIPIKIIICFLIFLNISCGYKVIKFESVDEIQYDGFINTNLYQTIITAQPDKDTTGHVDQRDSAYLNAKKVLADTVASNLVKYCIKKKNPNSVENFKISEESVSKLKAKLYKYVNYGKIAFEYYNENNSIVLGYRIEKNGLKYEIESLSFVLK
jgi:hypothetical protein